MTISTRIHPSVPVAAAYDWRAEPVGLYLHVPFCESKCIYCDFNSYAGMEFRYRPFVDALCADILRGNSFDLPGETDCRGQRISTVFIGGGTPSVLHPDQISAMLNAVRERYVLAPGAEITMEANPGTITSQKFEGYLRAGVNRLSMGVQVLDDRMLKKLGRIHSAAGAIESYRLAREAGFDNINLDFIFGLPGQDMANLESTLDSLLAVAPLPEHLSCYSLIVEENTPLYTGVRKGLISVPGDDEVADMYERIGERLTDAGYRQYEISNWTRALPCEHNLTYWHDRRYLAFGPGACGYWGNTRYSMLLDPGEYIRRVREGGSVIRERETIDTPLEMGEFMMVGLRLADGIRLAEFAARFGRDVREVYPREVEALEQAELLEEHDGWLRLTARGRLLGNEAFAKFID